MDYGDVIGRKVHVMIDRPAGSCHPVHHDIYYPINYGYIEDVIAPDGAGQDVYVLGTEEPLEVFDGVVIAVFHRTDDIEDKWIVAPEGVDFSDEEILRSIRFAEQFFEGYLISRVDRIGTEHLTIRRAAASDWEAIRDIWAEVSKTEYAQYDKPKELTDEAVALRIARWGSFAQSHEHMFFSVCFRETVIGYVAFNQRGEGYEIGYCFHPAFWGRGYAKESISELLKRLKAQKAAFVTAGTALENAPSVRLLRSLGFRQVGAERLSFYRDAQGNDVFFDGGLFELRLEESESYRSAEEADTVRI